MRDFKITKINSVLLAVLAAALYGISAPVSKLLLAEIPPTLMAALLYLGAGFGMLTVNFLRVASGRELTEAQITRKELPYVAAMILLDIAAPVLLMLGLTSTTSANAALLNNFEIVATSLIALFIFKEAIGRRMWYAISLITLASFILSVRDFGSLSFSIGSLYVLLACVCWGFENNCTRTLSGKDPLQIVVIKGLGSGIGALLVSAVMQEFSENFIYIGFALALGFVAYGLSIYFYIAAQRELGAARTSAYYAAAPFIGVMLSWLVLREEITTSFLAALAVMLAGTYLAVTEEHSHVHLHTAETHDHRHKHNDGHHNHAHPDFNGEHSHVHTHEILEHKHTHLPDLHHRHAH